MTDVPPMTSLPLNPAEPVAPGWPNGAAQCVDCGQLLWPAPDDDPEDWVDDQGRSTCWYRIDIGHVAGPIGSVDVPTYPAEISITEGGHRARGSHPSHRERSSATALLGLRPRSSQDPLGYAGRLHQMQPTDQEIHGGQGEGLLRELAPPDDGDVAGGPKERG